jgi:hypothetical protein
LSELISAECRQLFINHVRIVDDDMYLILICEIGIKPSPSFIENLTLNFSYFALLEGCEVACLDWQSYSHADLFKVES